MTVTSVEGRAVVTKRALGVLGRNASKVDAIDKFTGQAKFGADPTVISRP